MVRRGIVIKLFKKERGKKEGRKETNTEIGASVHLLPRNELHILWVK
jgi:hypothetical protein